MPNYKEALLKDHQNHPQDHQNHLQDHQNHKQDHQDHPSGGPGDLFVVLVVLGMVLVVLGVVLRQCSEQMFGTDSVRNNVPSQLSPPPLVDPVLGVPFKELLIMSSTV